MPTLSIILDGDGCWPDLAQKEVTAAASISAACLPGGMQSGAPSVSIRFDLPDGTVVVGETSLRLFLTAADAFRARHGDPRRSS